MRAVRDPTCQYTRSHKQCAQLTAMMFLPPTTRHTKHEWEGGRMGGGVMGGWGDGGWGGVEMGGREWMVQLWSKLWPFVEFLHYCDFVFIAVKCFTPTPTMWHHTLGYIPFCRQWVFFAMRDTCSQRKTAAVESSHRDDDDQKKSNIQKWD